MKLLELPLADDYPVNYDYIYIADGVLVRSPLCGTVFNLKAALAAKEIRNCDLFGHGDAKIGDKVIPITD